MKPLSGMWLYINLAFAIVWDFIGFILFIIGLIPAIQFIAVALSPVLDIVALMTDFIFCFLYQSYVQIYSGQFKLYQLSRIKDMMRLSKKYQGNKPNPMSIALARKTQQISKYIVGKFSDYVINFALARIRNAIITSTVELVPWIGDFSPTWTIKAWLHIKEHRKTAQELKVKSVEFEESLAKWRGSFRVGGVRRLKSNNNRGGIIRKSASNNPNPVKKQSNAPILQSLGRQLNTKPDTIQSASIKNRVNLNRGVTSSGSQIPNSRRDNMVSTANTSANNIRPFVRQVNTANVATSTSEGQDIRQVAANNIRPFRNKVPGEIDDSLPTKKDIQDTAVNKIPQSDTQLNRGMAQATTQVQDNNFANIQSADNNTNSMRGQVIGSIPQFLEYDDEELKYKKAKANKNQVSNQPISSESISLEAQKDQNISNDNELNKQNPASNNIKKFIRIPQKQTDVEKLYHKK